MYIKNEEVLCISALDLFCCLLLEIVFFLSFAFGILSQLPFQQSEHIHLPGSLQWLIMCLHCDIKEEAILAGAIHLRGSSV